MAAVMVALIDDHPVVQEGVRAWLAADPGRRVELVAAGDDVSLALTGPGAEADVVLLDLLAADDRPDRPALSEQEHTALLLWFRSMSKAGVAARMGIAESTVRQYIRRARIKYANAGRPAPTRTQLLVRAIEDGLIRADEVTSYASRAVPPTR